MPVKFEWRGDQILNRMKSAEMTGLKAVDDKIVENAQGRVRKNTENLHDAIRVIEEPHEADGLITSFVGVDDVDYAAAQETGPVSSSRSWGFTPYMRPAMDEEAPTLPEEIKKAFG